MHYWWKHIYIYIYEINERCRALALLYFLSILRFFFNLKLSWLSTTWDLGSTGLYSWGIGIKMVESRLMLIVHGVSIPENSYQDMRLILTRVLIASTHDQCPVLLFSNTISSQLIRRNLDYIYINLISCVLPSSFVNFSYTTKSWSSS